ncbi:hypothetical protein GCM10022393_08340 [Aquimarina addita]|uniref:HTH araC/xylS-type domain-containing protein n=1 Tax=Aquimarina addita TaxID=870485 RepID=A0ABP7XC27_9FLAO
MNYKHLRSLTNISIHKIHYSAFIFLFLFFFKTHSQFPPKEINYKELVKQSNGVDQASLTAQLQLGYYFVYRGRNIDSTLYFIKQIQNYQAQLDMKQKATLLNLQGKYYLDKSELDSAGIYFDKSLNIANTVQYKEVMSDSRNGKAAIAIYSSNYEEAISWLLESIDILEGYGDEIEIAGYEYNIGMFYVFTKNYEKAKYYHFKSLKRLEKANGDVTQSAMRYGALCNIYLKEKKVDSAQFCLSKIRNNGDEKYNNYFFFKGEIALSKNENQEAIINFKKSLDLLGTYRQKETAIRHNRIAWAYLNLKQSDEALLSLNIADSLLKDHTFPSLKRKQDSLYFEVYQLLGDSENSLRYLKKYQESVNKSLPITKIQSANNTENKYQINKKEKIITEQSDIMNTYLSKNKILYAVIIVVSIGFGFLFISAYQKKKKLKKEKNFIELQYQELNKSNLALIEKLKKISENLNSTNTQIKSSRYKRSSLSDQQRREYMDLILNFMNTEKPYLNSELTQKELADQLNISTHYLSEVLNSNFGKNFYSFINLYRVEEAKRSLENDSENLTMLAIAYDAGFNSKASFNRVFKDVTGVTPSSYKNENIGTPDP